MSAETDAAQRLLTDEMWADPIVEPDIVFAEDEPVWISGYDSALLGLCACICIGDVVRKADQRLHMRRLLELGESSYDDDAWDPPLHRSSRQTKKPPSAEAPGGRERGA